MMDTPEQKDKKWRAECSYGRLTCLRLFSEYMKNSSGQTPAVITAGFTAVMISSGHRLSGSMVTELYSLAATQAAAGFPLRKAAGEYDQDDKG